MRMSEKNNKTSNQSHNHGKNFVLENSRAVLGIYDSEIIENSESGKVKFFGSKTDSFVQHSLIHSLHDQPKNSGLFDSQFNNTANLPISQKASSNKDFSKEKKMNMPKRSERKNVNTSNDSDSHCTKNHNSNKSKAKENKKTTSQVKEYPRRRFNSDFLLLNKVKPNKA